MPLEENWWSEGRGNLLRVTQLAQGRIRIQTEESPSLVTILFLVLPAVIQMANTYFGSFTVTGSRLLWDMSAYHGSL